MSPEETKLLDHKSIFALEENLELICLLVFEIAFLVFDI